MGGRGAARLGAFSPLSLPGEKCQSRKGRVSGHAAGAGTQSRGGLSWGGRGARLIVFSSCRRRLLALVFGASLRSHHPS